jgi:hypothetical protein
MTRHSRRTTCVSLALIWSMRQPGEPEESRTPDMSARLHAFQGLIASHALRHSEPHLSKLYVLKRLSISRCRNTHIEYIPCNHLLMLERLSDTPKLQGEVACHARHIHRSP